MTTKEIMESKALLDDARESVQIFRDILRGQCENDLGISMDILEEILTPLVLDAADKVAYDQVDNSEDADQISQEEVEAIVMAGDGFSFFAIFNDTIVDPESTEYTKETEEEMKDVFSNLVTIILGERNIKILNKETEENVNKRLKYFSSPEYDKMLEKRRENYIEELRRDNIDYLKAKELKHSIQMIDSRYNLAFMAKVFGKTEKSRQQAIDRLRNNFFDKDKGEYTMKRFFDRCRRYDIPHRSYKKFIDLEERYLPEIYHPFNNFFIFIAISHIAYIYEENGGIEAHLILGNMEKLFTNTFSSELGKEMFIASVENMLDNFLPYTEMFKERNQLCSSHPVRIKKEKEREDQLRDLLYKRIEGDKLTEDGKITPELEAMSVKELLDFCNMRTSQIKYWESRFIKKKEMEALYDMVFTPYHIYKNEAGDMHLDQFSTVSAEDKRDYIISVWAGVGINPGIVIYDWRNRDIRLTGTLASSKMDVTTVIKRLQDILDHLPRAILIVNRGLGNLGDYIINGLQSNYKSQLFYMERENGFKFFGIIINRAIHDLMFLGLNYLTKLSPQLFRSGILVDQIGSLEKDSKNHAVIAGNVQHAIVSAFCMLFYAVAFLGGEFQKFNIQVSGDDFYMKIREHSEMDFRGWLVKESPAKSKVGNDGVIVENPIFKPDETGKVLSHGGVEVPMEIKEKDYPIGRGNTKPYIYPPITGGNESE